MWRLELSSWAAVELALSGDTAATQTPPPPDTPASEFFGESSSPAGGGLHIPRGVSASCRHY